MEEKCNMRNKRGPGRALRPHCHGSGGSEAEEDICTDNWDTNPGSSETQMHALPQAKGQQKTVPEAPIGGRE